MTEIVLALAALTGAIGLGCLVLLLSQIVDRLDAIHWSLVSVRQAIERATPPQEDR